MRKLLIRAADWLTDDRRFKLIVLTLLLIALAKLGNVEESAENAEANSGRALDRAAAAERAGNNAWNAAHDAEQAAERAALAVEALPRR